LRGRQKVRDNFSFMTTAKQALVACGLALAVLATLVIWWGASTCWWQGCQANSVIPGVSLEAKNFAECADRGYPVMESYPRQCRTPEGTLFVEEITPVVVATPESAIDCLKLDELKPNSVVASPLTISGQAACGWYFEASFPIEIVDANGVRLTIVPAQAQTDWMTTDFVAFSTTLTFATPTTPTGKIIFHKDNASGLPEHDARVEVPVRFVPAE
jgi:hypothetical protein